MIFSSSIWKFSTPSTLFFTFDDGPHPIATPKVLKTLAKYNIKATFFLTGKNVLRYPNIVKDIAQSGHTIGNHAFNHRRTLAFSKKKTLEEIQQTENVIKDIIEKPLKIFRPPFGYFSPFTISAVKQLNYHLIMWSFLTMDFKNWSDEKIITRTIKRSSNASILVFHDNEATQNKIGNLLAPIIEQLQERNFTFSAIEPHHLQ